MRSIIRWLGAVILVLLVWTMLSQLFHYVPSQQVAAQGVLEHSVLLPLVSNPSPLSIRSFSSHRGPAPGSYYLIVGEMVNESSQDVYAAGATLTLCDANGVPAMGNVWVSALYRWLEPGMASPYRGSVGAGPPENATVCGAVFRWDRTSNVTYTHALTVADTDGYWSGGYYYVVGKIINNTALTWEDVRPVVTLFSGGTPERVEATIEAGIAGHVLAPGEARVFIADFTYDGALQHSLTRYEVGVEGSRMPLAPGAQTAPGP